MQHGKWQIINQSLTSEAKENGEINSQLCLIPNNKKLSVSWCCWEEKTNQIQTVFLILLLFRHACAWTFIMGAAAPSGPLLTRHHFLEICNI